MKNKEVKYSAEALGHADRFVHHNLALVQIKKIIVLTLAIAVFLQPLQIQAYFMADKIKGSVYYNLDKKVYTKTKNNYGNIENWIKCGDYYYERFDNGNYITIRKVDESALKNGVLKIPSKLDGYQVLGVGIFDYESDLGLAYELSYESEYCCILEKPELLKEVVFSEGIEVIGIGAFSTCINLKRLCFPKSLAYIAYWAFYNCVKIQELLFPQGVMIGDNAFGQLQSRETVLYSNCVFPNYSVQTFVPNKNEKVKSKMYIKYYETSDCSYTGTGYLEKLYVDPRIANFSLSGTLYEIETIEEMVPDFHLKKLIVNSKCTKLNIQNQIDLSGIYTLKGAKSVKEAKKYKVPYYWKKTGKAVTVKGKKKNGVYLANWKKIKTTVCKYFFSTGKGRWKTKKSPGKTIYNVYGKKKKSGTYKFVRTTKKKSIKSEYKYVKAVPVKEWD